VQVGCFEFLVSILRWSKPPQHVKVNPLGEGGLCLPQWVLRFYYSLCFRDSCTNDKYWNRQPGLLIFNGKRPSYFHQPWHWQGQSNNWSHLDLVPSSLNQRNQAIHGHNQQTKNLARRRVPHSVSVRSPKPMLAVRLQLLLLPLPRSQPCKSPRPKPTLRNVSQNERSPNFKPPRLPSNLRGVVFLFLLGIRFLEIVGYVENIEHSSHCQRARLAQK
jgi:hypothetical protein